FAVSVAVAVATTTAAARARRAGLAVATVGLCLGVDGLVEALVAAAVAVLALLGERLRQTGADLLARQLHQAKARDLRHLVTGTVAAQALDEAAQQQLAVAGEHHVDEVDDDDAADVTQPELSHDLL